MKFTETLILDKPLRWGMVGGGQGSQIGYSHRDAAKRDGMFKLSAGAFDINAERGQAFGVSIGLDASRCYADYRTMFEIEAKRPDGIEVVSIATPNNSHYEICHAALTAGLHVVCEKPLANTYEQAVELFELANQHDGFLIIDEAHATGV